ncbi:MAG: glycosyltransferase family 2 protein [Desulfotalea sp.]
MLSVIVVSYNTASLLRNCLEKLFDTGKTLDMEVFVVDNNSADDSVTMVRKEFPQVILIANQDNRGFAAANNQAWQKAKGDYILLLNPDAFVKPDALKNAEAFMELHPQCGLCGGRLVKPDGSLDPSARRFPGWLSKFFTLSGLRARFPNSLLFSRHEFGGFDHASTMEVDWVPGTFTICRRTMLEQTGLFDERFYIYYEETDLCLKAKKMGWQVFFIPDAEVVHVGGASSKTRKDQQFDSGAGQVVKFRMCSEWLYYRKNSGLTAVLANSGVEFGWHLLRYTINLLPGRQFATEKRLESKAIIAGIISSLKDTSFGKVSPPTPW